MTRKRPLPLALRMLPLACLLVVTHHSMLIIARAQSASATLSGTVEDQNGAVVPGVNVTVLNTGTRLQREATTNDQGYFTIPLLPPSTYTVTVRRDGFAPVQVPSVVLNVGDQKALQIQLKAGDVNATVQITGEAPLINESPAVGTVVDRQFVENIPLNGRSFQSLITLTPGVVLVPSISVNNGIANGTFSVNGQRADANSFMVDGVSGNFGASPGFSGGPNSGGNLPGLTAFGTTQSLVSVDALQEFKVQTSTYAAEFGRQPGGQISIATRSGTNQFHGAAFDYLRNDKVDANDWFANAARQARPPERQNDLGGTFSGPVILPGYKGRNRTFFFFSYEGLRLRLPKFALINVPTLALRQAAPVAMQPILNAFPSPNGRDLGNGLAEFTSTYTDPSRLDAASIRVDHTINNKLTLFGRYNNAPSDSKTRSAGSLVQTNRVETQTLTIGATSSLSPRFGNELRINFSNNPAISSLIQDNFGGTVPVPRNVLIPSQYDSSIAQGAVALVFSGATAIPVIDITGAFLNPQRQFNIVDSFSYAVGSHQLKFGADFRRLMPESAANSYNFSATFTSQQQVLNATALSGSVSVNTRSKPRYVNFSAYGQDTWKLSQRLTLDLGLRWDVNPAPIDANGNMLPALTQTENLFATQAPAGTKLWRTTYNNLAPRIGAAYQLRQKAGRETIVRGGFGVFYDTGNDQGSAVFNGFPFVRRRTVTSVVFPLDLVQVAPPAPSSSTQTPAGGNALTVFDPALKLPYTLQWNFAVEQSLGRNQVLNISYVGAAGRRLLQQRQLSLAAINPLFTTIKLITNKATSDYNALQAKFQRRLSRGLQMLASYTWSHALDDDSVDNATIIPVRGNAAFDVRHIFATAVTYDIPKAGHDRFLNAVLGYWSLDTNIHAQSALPVDIIASNVVNPVDGTLVGNRPIVIQGVPVYLYASQYPGGRIINNTVPTAAQAAAAGCAPLTATNAKGAFCTPPTGTFGNLGRNVIRGLPAWQVDLALRRQFKLTEKVNLQFRAEAFNIFNHPNFGAISTTLTAANFGQATNMLNRQLGGLSQLYQIGGPRSFQFALKLEF